LSSTSPPLAPDHQRDDVASTRPSVVVSEIKSRNKNAAVDG
jgi:hypothetical protein